MSKIRPLFAWPDLEVVVHAFISPRLEYFSSLYSGCSNKALTRLQLVQNAAAHLLPYTKIQAHISSVLASLHRLPVTFRMDFKILLVTFTARHGSASSYMTDLLLPYEPEHSLRSSGWLFPSLHSGLKVTEVLLWRPLSPGTHCLRIWHNSLCVAESVISLKSLLKAFFSKKAFHQFYLFIHTHISILIFGVNVLLILRVSALFLYFNCLILILIGLILYNVGPCEALCNFGLKSDV